MATKATETFPAKALANEITKLMTCNPDVYGKNIWRAANHTLKEWCLPSLTDLDDKHWEKLNKALCHALEGH